MSILRDYEVITNIVEMVERETGEKVSDEVIERLYDIVNDGSFGKDAHKFGSTRDEVLEELVYDVIEEIDGIE